MAESFLKDLIVRWSVSFFFGKLATKRKLEPEVGSKTEVAENRSQHNEEYLFFPFFLFVNLGKGENIKTSFISFCPRSNELCVIVNPAAERVC